MFYYWPKSDKSVTLWTPSSPHWFGNLSLSSYSSPDHLVSLPAMSRSHVRWFGRPSHHFWSPSSLFPSRQHWGGGGRDKVWPCQPLTDPPTDTDGRPKKRPEEDEANASATWHHLALFAPVPSPPKISESRRSFSGRGHFAFLRDSFSFATNII